MKTATIHGSMLALLVLSATGPLLAEPPDTGYQAGVMLETYPDRWQLAGSHSDASASSSNNLSLLNVHLSNFLRPDSGYLFGVDGHMRWREDVGDAWRESSPGSESDYRSMRLEAEGGYRFGAPGDAVRYDLRMGMGYRGWSRERMPGSGLTDEDQAVLYTQFSGGPRFQSGAWQGYLEMGVRMPLSLADPGTVEGLEGAQPNGNGRRSSGFISFQNQFQMGDSSALRLDLYYDSARYGVSDTRNAHALYGDELRNGRDQDVIGVEMGLQF